MQVFQFTKSFSAKQLLFVALAAVSCLSGCTSMNLIAPDSSMLERTVDAPPKVKVTVGYFIPNQYRYAVVRTSNGAISYYPYRDVEAGYRKVLTNVFENVIRLDSLNEYESMKAEGIQVVFAPELTTSLVAPGIPLVKQTTFTVEVTSNMRCAGSGVLVAKPQVVGESGTDAFESLVDESAAGRRAVGDALHKLQDELSNPKFAGNGLAEMCGRAVAVQ